MPHRREPINNIRFGNEFPEAGKECEVILNYNAGFTPDDIESIEYEWFVESDRRERNVAVTMGASANNTPYNGDHVLTGRRESWFNITGIFGLATGSNNDDIGDGGDADLYVNRTDEEIRQSYRNMLNGQDDYGRTRSEYLNSETTGYICLDYEHPRNLGGCHIYTEEELQWFVEGLIRRIQIFREFVPHAKLSVWRFGDTGHGFQVTEAGREQWELKLQRQIFCSDIEYNGQKLYDAIDWFAPVIYHRYFPDSEYSDAEMNGVRSDHIKEIVNAFRDHHGYSKEICAITAVTGEGGPYDNKNNDEMNKIELSRILNDGICDTFFFWYALSTEMISQQGQGTDNFARKRDEILLSMGYDYDSENYDVPGDEPFELYRLPGVYEKEMYFAAGTNINEEMSSRSDWTVDNSTGKQEITFSSQFDATTAIAGVVIDWRSHNFDQINNLQDVQFAGHLQQLKDKWIAYLAQNIRDKQANGLDMNEIDIYCSDPEIHAADNAFSYGLYLAAKYQVESAMGIPTTSNELASNPYFRYNQLTGRCTATSKANIFASVWLEQQYYDLITVEYADLGLENKFIHYNLPYRFASNGMNIFNNRLSGSTRQEKRDYIIDVYRTMSGEIDQIEGLDHETLNRVYETMGTFVDFYPPHYADSYTSWMAFIDALDQFGVPGKNTLMASGQFNSYMGVGGQPCNDWKDQPDVRSKPYYDENDFFTVTTPAEEQSYTYIPLSAWIYFQEYINNNTNINYHRFYNYGPDTTMFNWVGNGSQQRTLAKMNVQIPSEFGVPYSSPPTEQDKVNYSRFRAYGQFTPDKVYEPRTTNRREFVPDHRSMFWINVSAQSVNNALAHWKINEAPYDSNGNSILRKSNPQTTDPTEDGILYLVSEDLENPGILEYAYRRGYRRFSLRGLMGMRTTAADYQGSGVPSAIWSAGDPNLGTWNDKRTLDTGDSIEYPFTSTGNLVSEDPNAVIGNRQLSCLNFLGRWIQSKKDAGDPVDVYIYTAYQAALLDDGTPNRGNLSISLFQDADWDRNRDDGIHRERFPLGDFRDAAQREFFDGENIPWMEIGAKGFIIDASSFASSENPVGAVDPVLRPPGHFDYYRDDLKVDVLGEAVPLSNYDPPNAAMNEDLYRETGFVGYSNFWGERWKNITISPDDSEIHIVLVWSFAGGPGGINTPYATNPGTNDVSYDLEGIKDEIDQMRRQGFVVSCGFNRYSGPSPVAEGPARDEIIDYIQSVGA